MADFKAVRTSACHKAFAIRGGITASGTYSVCRAEALGRLGACCSHACISNCALGDCHLSSTEDFLMAFSRFNDVRGKL